MKLRELIDEYEATGVIRYDKGNGSAGPVWIEWDEEINNELGDIDMRSVHPQGHAYGLPKDEYDKTDTFAQVAKYVIRDDHETAEIWVSDWIDGDNGYEYRILF